MVDGHPAFRAVFYPMQVLAAKMQSVMQEGVYKLSEDQREFYNNNGYLVITGLIGFDVLYACKRHFQNICRGSVSKGSMIVMKELSLINTGAKGENLINKVQDILFDEVFSTYTENPKLLAIVSQFIGPNVRAMHSMLINKPPGTSEHPPHQDLHYFPFRPVDRILASWTAMEEVTRENGCLYVIPGSHKKGVLYPHDYPVSESGAVNKAYHGIVEAASVAPVTERVHLHMSPGDTVFFHPLLVHGSGTNYSKGYRKAISCHYAASECQYIDVKGTSQENIAREVEGMASKMGFDVNFQDVWKYRSKMVLGVKCNL